MSVLDKFVSQGVVGDVIDERPFSVCQVTYASGTSAQGLELTPTEVKDEPKVEWETEDGAFYTLLLTGN